MHRFVDFVVAMLLVSALMAVAEWRHHQHGPSQWMDRDQNDHLGAEYDDIARSIRSGQGFSSPFRVQSGPTAWMPPVLPYLQAGLYWISEDDRALVIELILVMKGIVLVLSGFLTLTYARQLRLWIPAVLLLTVFFAAHFQELFQITHDVWLTMLVVNVMWLGFSSPGFSAERSWKVVVSWGVFGGLAALVSPVAGFTWAGMMVFRCRPWRLLFDRSNPVARGMCVGLVIAGAVSILVVAPWIIRNRVVLGKWSPVKSNGMYEVWQSLCVDDDGVIDGKTFSRHPWSSDGDQRQQYLAMGEIAFIDSRWPEVRASIRDSPLECCARIGRRAIAALEYYQPVHPAEATDRPWPLFLKRILFPAPFIGWLIIVACSTPARSRDGFAAVGIYALWLGPYILVSYYDRYAAPLIVLKVMLILQAIATLRDWARPPAVQPDAEQPPG